MKSSEFIKRFPKNPTEPILFVVYNEQMVDDAAFLISTIHSIEYLDEHVTIVAFNSTDKIETDKYQVYIDPTVFTYKKSWNE